MSLDIKEAANMVITPDGNALILAGGATCDLEYGRIIEFNFADNEIVRDYYVGQEAQLWKWGGVTVMRSHVDLTP